MAHIVPIDRAKSLHISAEQPTARDPFDVVVFLNHFLESDRYPDAIISQIAPAREKASRQVAKVSRKASQQLKMQLGKHNLAFSLGRG